MHSVPGFLEQMDHQVDTFSKDEENQENKGLKKTIVCTRDEEGKVSLPAQL